MVVLHYTSTSIDLNQEKFHDSSNPNHTKMGDQAFTMGSRVEVSIKDHGAYVENLDKSQMKETKRVVALHNQSIKWNRLKRTIKKPQARRDYPSATGTKGLARENNVEEIVERECVTEEIPMLDKVVEGALAENPSETPGKSPLEFIKVQKQQIKDPELMVNDEINGLTDRESNLQKKRGRPQKSLDEKQTGEGDIRAEGLREMVVKDCVMNVAEVHAGLDCLKLMTNVAKPNEQFQLNTNNKKLPSDLQRHDDILNRITDIPLAENDNQASQTVARNRVKLLEKSVSNGQGQKSSIVERESQIEDCLYVSRGRTSESNAVDIMIDEIIGDVTDDQPILAWFKDKHSQTDADYSRVTPVGSFEQCAKAIDREDENKISSSAIATRDSVKSSPLQKTTTNDSGVLPGRNLNNCIEASDREGENGTPSANVISGSVDKNQSLPFVKRSPLWKTIESMEIFHKIPQKPHFSSLLNCDEERREGLAIGHMVTFYNVVGSMSKLQFCDSSNIIDRSLETLTNLECHGFDVRPVRARLNELLSKIKMKLELQNESKEIEDEMMKDINDKAECDNEINIIILKMRELEEKLKAASSIKEGKDQKIATLRSKQDVLRQSVMSVQRDFESIIASPW